MSTWEDMWDIVRYGATAILILLVALAIYIIIAGIVGHIKTVLRRKRLVYVPSVSIRQDDFMAEATIVARAHYPVDTAKMEAFRDGARWAWTFFSRP